MAYGFRFQFEPVDTTNARRIAQRVVNLGEDPRPLLDIAGSVMERSVINRFDGEHGPNGIPWPKSRRAGGFSVGRAGPRQPRAGLGKTLTDTGDLRDSLRQEVDARSVAVGFDGLKNPVKAVANQFGSHRQTVVVGHIRIINQAFGLPLKEPKSVNVRPHGMITNLPARPMIGIDEEDKRDIHDGWLGYLLGLLK